MELTPEERQRIYFEEKARLEQGGSDKESDSLSMMREIRSGRTSAQFTTAQVTKTRRRIRIVLGLSVVFLGIVYLLLSGTQTSAPTDSDRGIGTTTTIVSDTGFFTCGSTPAALDEMTKWAALKDSQEVVRTLITTGSTRVEPGTGVKILDTKGAFSTQLKVRILSGTAAGRECWMNRDWLN